MTRSWRKKTTTTCTTGIKKYVEKGAAEQLRLFFLMHSSVHGDVSRLHKTKVQQLVTEF